MKLRNYRIMNMDVTLILQKPRVAKYKPAMKVRRSPRGQGGVGCSVRAVGCAARRAERVRFARAGMFCSLDV
jgi:2C-methyl-D-erythritol 2,4-cyclodiphosphate synthase